MGTKMAPGYANIFMGELEQKLIVKGKPHILIWKRLPTNPRNSYGHKNGPSICQHIYG